MISDHAAPRILHSNLFLYLAAPPALLPPAPSHLSPDTYLTVAPWQLDPAPAVQP